MKKGNIKRNYIPTANEGSTTSNFVSKRKNESGKSDYSPKATGENKKSKYAPRATGENTKSKYAPRATGENTKSKYAPRITGENIKSKYVPKVNEDKQGNKRNEKEVEPEKPFREDVVEGRNAVIELLKSDRTIECIMMAKGDMEGSINVVYKLAKEKNIVIKEADRRKLDTIAQTGSHQGVIAFVTPFEYCEVQDILGYAKRKGEDPFILIVDEIEDPHNLGALIRTAEACGVHGIIIPKRRNVGITPVVYKASAGAIEHMRIAKVTNINAAIDTLKKNDVWIYGADMNGEKSFYDVDFKGSAAIVIGSEGRGISKLTRERCDVLTRIPMVGKISSLNASVAGGILMYEVLKQNIMRNKK